MLFLNLTNLFCWIFYKKTFIITLIITHLYISYAATQTINLTVPQTLIQSSGPKPIRQPNDFIRPPDQRMVSQVDLVEMGRSSELSLNQLDLSGVNMHTRMILEEKEQALLASQETIQVCFL